MSMCGRRFRGGQAAMHWCGDPARVVPDGPGSTSSSGEPFSSFR